MDRDVAVLVVDDDESSRGFQRDVLAVAGYQVRVAGSGTEALAMLSGGAFDLVLLDVRMPGVDGLEVLRSALHGYGTPYAHLLDAVCLTLPAVDAGTAERFAALLAQGPPQETVGLDRPLLPFPTTRPAEVPA